MVISCFPNYEFYDIFTKSKITQAADLLLDDQ